MVAMTMSFSFPSLPCTIPTNCEPLHNKIFSTLPSSTTPYFKKPVKCSNDKSEVRRPPSTAKHYHPSVWDGYDFISSSAGDLKPATFADEKLEELKKKVQIMLPLAANDPFQELDLIDKIQRLGVAYHFETEIEDILLRVYNNDTYFFHQNIADDHARLYIVSLWFRLLRQAGYYVSPDVFNMFRDEKGGFHASLASDVQSLLSLYEASYLSLNGEDIMDEAMVFATKHLKSMVTSLSHPLSLEVQSALKLPLQRSLERLQAKHYISIYQEYKSRNETLLKFAKSDFNIVQFLHQKEINELSKWWKRINIKSKLPFDIRDRLVEAYIINMGVNFVPQFSQGRMHLTKIWCMLSVIDDAHDVYGDLGELQLLCDALQRWDAGNVNELPYHMKVIFLEVLSLFNEIEMDMTRRGHFIGMPYLKRKIQNFTKAQFEEAKSLFSSEIPTLEKWLSESIHTGDLSTYLVVAVMHFGELASKEIFNWIASMPKILNCYNLIGRILDDIVGFKEEGDRGITVSSVACYIKEHGVSESEAIESLQNMITSLWKDMNQECLRPNLVPRPILKIILNIARNMVLFYSDEDGHTNSKGRTKEIITSLLIDHLPV